MIYFRTGMEGWSITRANVEAAGFTVASSSKTSFNDNDVIVNWGCLTPAEGGKQLNLPEAVKKCCDKPQTLAIIGELMPKVYDGYSEEIPLPFVMKKNGTHKGMGKRKVSRHTLKIGRMAAEYDTFQEFLDIQKEYRIITMMCGEKRIIFRMYEKVKNGLPSPREIFHPSWDFQRRTLDDVPVEIRKMCLDASQTLGIDFVGFDVAVTPNGNVIIEANSAPGLGPDCAKKLFRKLSETFPSAINE